MPELWWVREFWRPQAYPHPLSVRILLLDMEEMRLQDGWGRDGKRGAHRIDRLPPDAAGEQWVRSTADIAALLPPLPPVFTRADLARALRLLEEVGAVRRTSRSRRVRCPMRGLIVDKPHHLYKQTNAPLCDDCTERRVYL